MAIQACFDNTGLTINDAQAKAYESGKFKVVPPDEKRVTWLMLTTKQTPYVSVQILGQEKANIWCGYHKLDEIKEFLNETLGDNVNPKPFKEPYKIVFKEGEFRKILEEPLGLVIMFMYCYPSVIADALDQVISYMDNWDSWVKHP